MKTSFVCFLERNEKKSSPFVLLMQNELIIIIHNNVYFSRFDEILFMTI
jgi:hypothetical protein